MRSSRLILHGKSTLLKRRKNQWQNCSSGKASAAKGQDTRRVQTHGLFTVCVLLLVAGAIVRSAVATRLDGWTMDEAYHIAAGVSYVRSGDFRMNPEHPPLVKLWVGSLVSAHWLPFKRAAQIRRQAGRTGIAEEEVYQHNNFESVQRRPVWRCLPLTGCYSPGSRSQCAGPLLRRRPGYFAGSHHRSDGSGPPARCHDGFARVPTDRDGGCAGDPGLPKLAMDRPGPLLVSDRLDAGREAFGAHRLPCPAGPLARSVLLVYRPAAPHCNRKAAPSACLSSRQSPCWR